MNFILSLPSSHLLSTPYSSSEVAVLIMLPVIRLTARISHFPIPYLFVAIADIVEEFKKINEE